MPEHLHKYLLLTLALLTGGTSATAADDERWYRVELLVIGQSDEQHSEQFEPEPTLEYPDAFRFLFHPEQLRELQGQQLALENENPVELDEFGRVLITLPAQEIAEEEHSEAAVPLAPNELQRSEAPVQLEPIELQHEALLATANVEPETPEEDLPPPRPTPFTALPEDLRELNSAARTLARSGRYSVLFHQSWNQPIVEQGQALPIVLDDSGDSNQWSELQGSVLLYRSRYLHLATNLWRNTDGRYLHRQWRMAPAPLGPPSIIIERPPPPEIPRIPGLAEVTGVPDSASAPPDLAALAAAASVSADNVDGPVDDALDDAALDSAALDDEALDTELSLDPVYPYRHAVLMQQARRMRSNEVHYIDHPMLGLVIKITPLTEEDLVIQAELENQLWPHLKQALDQTQIQALDEALDQPPEQGLN